MREGARPPRDATTGDARLDVVLAVDARGLQWRQHLLLVRAARKHVHIPLAVDEDLAGARVEAYARDRSLATAGAVEISLRCCHNLLLRRRGALRCLALGGRALLARAGVHLRLVRVIGAGVHLQPLEEPRAQRVVRQHALHGVFDDALRTRGQQLLLGNALEAARVLGVPPVLLLAHIARDLHLGGIHDDDEVAVRHRRCEGRAVLPAQRRRHFRGESPERLAVGVDDVPLLFDVFRLQ